MPPTTPPKVKTKFTNTAGERVTVMTDGTKTRVPGAKSTPTTPTTDIPVTSIENKATPVAMPPTPILSDPAPEARTAADAYLSQIQAEAQARLQKAETAGTESENKIRSLMGLANTEEATRTKLEETRGVTAIEEQMRKAEQSIASQIAEIDAFDLKNVTDVEGMRIDASRNDVTKGTFGARAAEFNLQRTVERAGMAAGLRATVAGNLALQGNLEAATEQVNKALKSIYDPIRQGLEMEKFFLQRNDVRLGEARAEARDLRMKAIDRQFKEIDRAQSLSDNAVASGYAGPNEIKQLTALAGNPVAQAEYAQQIVARGAREMMALERAAKNASISASGLSARKSLMELALAGDRKAVQQLGFDPGASARIEKTAAEMKQQQTILDKSQKTLGDVNRALGMTRAISNTSGTVQSPYLSGLVLGPTMATQEKRNIFGKTLAMMPGVGNFINASATKNEANDFLGLANNILLGEGFNHFVKLAESGVKLTPISNVELDLIMASSNYLMSVAEKKDGKIVGFNVDDAVVQQELAKIANSNEVIVNETKAQMELGNDAYNELIQMYRNQ